MPPSRSKEPSVRMPSAGHAQATINTKKNCLRIANLFLEHVAEVSPDLTAKWGTVWEEIPEQYAADMEIYEHIATYLVKTYIIDEGNRGAGGSLSSRVATQDWSEMIQNQKARFSKSSEQKTKVRRAREHPYCSPYLTLCARTARRTSSHA